MPVSEVTIKALGQSLDFNSVHGSSPDTERVTALRTVGWLPLLRLYSICNEGLKTGFGAPFESAAAAFLHVVRSAIAFILITTKAVVQIR